MFDLFVSLGWRLVMAKTKQVEYKLDRETFNQMVDLIIAIFEDSGLTERFPIVDQIADFLDERRTLLYYLFTVFFAEDEGTAKKLIAGKAEERKSPPEKKGKKLRKRVELDEDEDEDEDEEEEEDDDIDTLLSKLK